MPLYATYNSGLSAEENARIGKIATPLKMYIESQSDLLRKQGGPLDWLFNVETSDRFAETIVGGNEFSEFEMVPEGGSAPNDTFGEIWKKIITHDQFMKGFHITKTMMEDSNYKVTSEMTARAGKFIRAYYLTRHSIATQMLTNATNSVVRYAGMDFDLTTMDEQPLFSNAHKFGAEGDTQSNNFYFVGANGPEASAMETVLAASASAMMDFNDDNGVPMGYNPDTIIIPSNRVALKLAVSKAAGSDQEPGTANNSINTQVGRWNIIVLPKWRTNKDEFLVMSSDANKDLLGNVFFDRAPLEIMDRIDLPTWNLDFSARCRFGAGFGNYRHISRVEIVKSGSAAGATLLPTD